MMRNLLRRWTNADMEKTKRYSSIFITRQPGKSMNYYPLKRSLHATLNFCAYLFLAKNKSNPLIATMSTQ